jgi:hypothetical protein
MASIFGTARPYQSHGKQTTAIYVIGNRLEPPLSSSC